MESLTAMGTWQKKSNHIKNYAHGATTGWQNTCACDRPDVEPCVVLDPFGGSGTVGVVARDLGRKSILIEVNPEYKALIEGRLRKGNELFENV